MKSYLSKLICLFFTVTLLSLSFGALSALAFQPEGCSGDCTGCHALTKEEAAKLLHTDKYKAVVKDIKLSAVKGLWEVSVSQDGKIITLYIDFAKQYLVEGRFIPLEEIGKGPELKVVDPASIPLESALLIGDKNAKHKVIVFDDPDCSFCAKLHKEIKRIVKERADIAFYIKLYPLPSHTEAYAKATAIVCAGSVKLLEDAYAGKTLPKPNCETDEIDNNLKLAKELGIGGTPATVLPDGRLLPGYVPADVLIDLIDSPLEPKTESK
ncbi:MAG: DsbC family protein [Proteobacteria bacterium]|nr:DsbC family protein [Pseudomonadota bacterium]